MGGVVVRSPSQRAAQYGDAIQVLGPNFDGRVMLVDLDGNPIWQAWDPATREFVPFTGKGEAVDVRVVETPPPTLAEADVPVPVASGDLVAPPGASLVSLRLQGGRVRFKTTGTAATASEGQIAPELSSIRMSAAEAATFTAAVVSGAPTLWARWT